MEVYFEKFHYGRWQKYNATDFQFMVYGGPITSAGDMNGVVIIKQPKADKRLKSGKRYVEFDRIPCIIKCQGHAGYEGSCQVLMFPENYVKTII